MRAYGSGCRLAYRFVRSTRSALAVWRLRGIDVETFATAFDRRREVRCLLHDPSPTENSAFANDSSGRRRLPFDDGMRGLFQGADECRR